MPRRLLLLCARPPAPPQTVDIVMASTTDVHGRVRGWDYFADTAESDARTRPRRDDRRFRARRESGPRDSRRRRRFSSGQSVHVRRRADRYHGAERSRRRDERDALRRGDGRKPRVQLRRAGLRRETSTAKFPLLAANATGGTARLPWRAWTMVERAGVKIGMVGATTPGSMMWDAANLRAANVTVGAIEPAVAKTVGRSARGRSRRDRRRGARRHQRRVGERHRVRGRRSAAKIRWPKLRATCRGST